ncbi:CPBP family intramembrane glutamic endopeptidase [Psychromonas aquimarina]|uniref:CPBP family intramembrane glutamic endopeptidase n=1 Tax=Psychromonas aquimarina TaxID=444919 RepID=UPI000427E156|nr:CPBP family intramembrane glutamic endopeptidase [Psychromonas aquimarina]
MDRLSSKTEFFTVILIGFGYLTLSSLEFAFTASNQQVVFSNSGLEFLMVYETIVLLFLGVFLYSRGWKFHWLGLKPYKTDPIVGIGIALFSYLSYVIVYELFLYFTSAGINEDVFSGNLDLLYVIIISIINPIFEEVLVCGYVISYFKQSSKSFWFAINVSLLIRLSYHLYQGTVGVLSIIPLGLVFTYWFAKTGRLWPVIIAHILFDFIGLVVFV